MNPSLRDVSTIGDIRRRKRIATGIFSLLLGIFLCVDFALWFALRSGIFSIHSVEFVGNEEATDAQVKDILWSQMFVGAEWKHILGERNILAWPDELSGEQLRFLPAVKHLAIKKDFFARKVTITVEERQPIGIWCWKSVEEKCVWFDEDGIGTKRAFGGEGQLIFLVNDYASPSAPLGGVVIRSDWFSALRSALGALSVAGLSAREVRVDDAKTAEFSVATYEGPRVYLSFAFFLGDIRPVIERITAEKPLSQIDYIDFRVRDKIYYK